MRYFAIIGALALTGCLPQFDKSTIEVDGRATIYAEPDNFELSATIRTQTDRRDTSLAKTAEVFSAVKGALPELEGLTELTIKASDVSLYPVRDTECTSDNYDDDACPVVAFGAVISLEISGSPASSAGAALSMLSELGVEEATLDGYRISNLAEKRAEALSAAVADARAKAEIIATASGATVKGVARIQSGKGFSKAYMESEADEIIVTAALTRQPAISLELEPQPIAISADVVAAFAIE